MANDPRQQLLESAGAILDRLLILLSDLQFRQDLRGLAMAVLELLPEQPGAERPADAGEKRDEVARPQSAGESPGEPWSSLDPPVVPVSDAVLRAAEPVQPGFAPAAPAAIESLMNRFNRTVAPEPAPLPARGLTLERGPAADTAPLVIVEKRCRLKAEAAQWAAERRRRLRAGANFHTEIDPTDRDLIARAKQLEDCYLWTSTLTCPEPDDLTEFERLGRSFTALADAIECVKLATENDALGQDDLEEALQLLATSQALVRVIANQIGYDRADRDQETVFRWLDQYTRDFRVYIQQHMRLADSPSPSLIDLIEELISQTDERLNSVVRREKEHRKLFQKVRYEASRMLNDPHYFEQHTRALFAAVEQLVAEGIKPSNTGLREIMLPVADHLETLDELPHGVFQVLREISRFRASNPGSASTPASGVAWSVQVAELEEKLRGKAVLLIGGEMQHFRKRTIEEAFGLSELVWESTEEHSSIEFFRPAVQRPDVVLVLLAIRWSSHSYGEVQEFCRTFDKPLVRLPCGLHPNQIAHQVLAQASRQLVPV
jgi:hypothetical protein